MVSKQVNTAVDYCNGWVGGLRGDPEDLTPDVSVFQTKEAAGVPVVN